MQLQTSICPVETTHHGGSPQLATLFLTSECNLRCPYCYALENVFKADPVWPIEASGPLLDLLAERGYRVSLGGGEPLTRPGLVLALAQQVSRRNMGVALLTNGYLLEDRLLADLREAGIGWIQISADSACEVEHFAPLLRAGHALGIRMAVGTVLLPEHVSQIRQMHDVLASCDVAGWRMLRYTPLNAGPRLGRAPSNREWIDMLLRVETVVRPLASPVQIRYEPSVVPLAWLLEQPPEHRLDVCGGRQSRRVFLYPNGETFACGLPRRKGMVLGNWRTGLPAMADLLGKDISRPYRPDLQAPVSDAYCHNVCNGGCVQMRGDLPCDPRCDWPNGLVPTCCFEKLLLSAGSSTPGNVTYPSDVFSRASEAR